MTRLHRSEFLRQAKELFPDLRPALNREYGLLNLEMHVFCDFVQAAIDAGDRERVTKAFAFCGKLLAQGNSDMVNALTVSLLEHLNFEDGQKPRSWARPLMSPALAKQHQHIVQYNRERASKKVSS